MVSHHSNATSAQDTRMIWDKIGARMMQGATVHQMVLLQQGVGGVGRRLVVDSKCTQREWYWRVPIVAQL
jgi:hypothetical protein